MDKVREMVAGKKTYLVALGALIAATVAWSTGAMSAKEAIEAAFAALATITLRAGIAKTTPTE
jgi:hypothetical protein